jgi:hypothetical protein
MDSLLLVLIVLVASALFLQGFMAWRRLGPPARVCPRCLGERITRYDYCLDCRKGIRVRQ